MPARVFEDVSDKPAAKGKFDRSRQRAYQLANGSLAVVDAEFADDPAHAGDGDLVVMLDAAELDADGERTGGSVRHSVTIKVNAGGAAPSELSVQQDVERGRQAALQQLNSRNAARRTLMNMTGVGVSQPRKKD